MAVFFFWLAIALWTLNLFASFLIKHKQAPHPTAWQSAGYFCMLAAVMSRILQIDGATLRQLASSIDHLAVAFSSAMQSCQ